MPPRKDTDPPVRRKRKPRDLNAEVAGAFGAATGTEIPKVEESLESEDVQRPAEEQEEKGSLADRGDREG